MSSQETASETPDDSETTLHQTHIFNPDCEYTVHGAVTIDPSDSQIISDDYPAEIALTEGGNITEGTNFPTPTEDRPWVLRNNPELRIERAVTHKPANAIGRFLYNLELHEVDETDALDQLEANATETDLNIAAYTDHIASLTRSDRKLKLLNLAEARVKQMNDWASEPYLNVSTWRKTNLNESGKSFADRVFRNIEIDIEKCYGNAQRAAIKHADNHLVEYAEGLVLPKQAPQTIRHAWIEYDGNVVELTFPNHQFDGDNAVYFGTTFPTETVKEMYNERNGGSPLVLTDDEFTRFRKIQGEM